MNRFYNIIKLIVLLIIIYSTTFSQTPRMIGVKDLAVACWVKVETNPPAIIINWKPTDLTTQFQITKKGLGDQAWSNPIATITNNTTTSFRDENVQLDTTYEYEITALGIGGFTVQENGPDGKPKDTVVALGFLGFGYLCSGIQVQPPSNNGKAIILIDETLKDALPDEISRLQDDMNAEGWGVIIKYVPRSEKFDSANVINNKKLIADEYNNDPLNVKAVFLLGRVAVPYSGRFNQGNAWLDAHPDHKGAWPADLYYGFMNEAYWTDQSVFDTSASRKENWNKPFDGKFDLSTFNTGMVDLMVGRVDFYNMPTWTSATDPNTKKTEIELIQKYLDKDHNYRIGETSPVYRGIISDNFGLYGNEGFAASGWRSLMALVGPDSVRSGNLFNTLGVENYLWAYGCGGGWYQGASGIGNTTDFSQKPFNATFTLLFGSYFGDWDSQDNFIRACLASSPYTLTCGWSGRPHWYMHQMGMGLPVGFSSRATQNNYLTYKPNSYYLNTTPSIQAAGIKATATSLQGDPTLNMWSGTVKPPKNLSVVQPPGRPIEISWESSDDKNVTGYNVYRSTEKFGLYNKVNSDMIIADNKFIDTNLYEGSLYYMVKALKLQVTNSGSFFNTSIGIRKLILATPVGENPELKFAFTCNPNPAKDFVNISLTLDSNTPINVGGYDLTGNLRKTIITRELGAGSQELVWNLRDNSENKVTAGVYLVKLNYGSMLYVQKVVVMP